MVVGSDLPPAGMKDVRGFTLVVLLLVLVGLSLALTLAQPSLHRARVEARATELVEVLNLVREGALAYRSEQGAWPEGGRRGRIPAGLAGYLPEDLNFQDPHYVLDLENWALEGSGVFEVGVSFYTYDQEVGFAVLGMLGTNAWTDGQSKFTWVIED